MALGKVGRGRGKKNTSRERELGGKGAFFYRVCRYIFLFFSAVAALRHETLLFSLFPFLERGYFLTRGFLETIGGRKGGVLILLEIVLRPF